MTPLYFLPIESKSLSKITRCSSFNNSIWGDSSNHLTRDISVSTKSTVDDSFRATSASVVSFPSLPSLILYPNCILPSSPFSPLLYFFFISEYQTAQNILYNQESTWILHNTAFTPRVMGSQECTIMPCIFGTEIRTHSFMCARQTLENWAIFQSY